jgi:hypothetical protein
MANSYGETHVEGSVEGVWSPDGSPFLVDGDVSISASDTLIIQPGVEVLFNGGYRFDVRGALFAEGAEGDSIYFGPSEGEPWRGLRFAGADNNCRLDYCVIERGRATQGNGGFDEPSCGGNLYVDNTDLSIRHSRISGGHALGYGGGIFIKDSEVDIKACLIVENEATVLAGGLGLQNVSGSFSDCMIIANVSALGGAGMYLIGESAPEISNCQFSGNVTQSSGGAMNINEGADPYIHHCLFNNNNAGAGGAIYIRGEGTHPIIEWCKFNQNSARTEVKVGGAIYIRGQSPAEIRYNQISQNNADYGGGIYIKEPPRCLLNHNLFLKNGATIAGGAIGTSNDLGDTPLVLGNCTFIDNIETGLNPEAHLGYIREGANLVITSSVVWGEAPHFSGGGGITVRYSNVKNGYDGEENSAENPLFFAGDSTWFILDWQSPCIDSGDPDLPGDQDEDPDQTRCDRNWLHYPQNASDGILTDPLETSLWVNQRASLVLRYRNDTDVPLYITPMDLWREPDPMLLLNVSDLTGDSIITGVAHTRDGFFLCGTGGEDGRNMIHQIDAELNYVDSFPQPGNPGGDGFFDLADDGGSILYGGYGNEVFEFTTRGEFGDRYNGPGLVRNYTALSADFWSPHLFVDYYIAGEEGLILRADAELWPRDTIDVGASVISLGVKRNTRALYMVTEPEENEYLLSLVVPDENRVIPIYRLTPPEGVYTIGGIEITHGLNPERGMLVGIWRGDNGSDDIMFTAELYTAWLDIKPDRRFLLPGEETEWEIGFVGNMETAGEYESIFYLPVNGGGEGMDVHARLESMNSVDPGSEPTPETCRLEVLHPNPFNSYAKFSFFLPLMQKYEITLFDQSGRKVRHILSGTGEAGWHWSGIDAAGMPSGTYFIKLTAPSGSAVQPLTIMK